MGSLLTLQVLSNEMGNLIVQEPKENFSGYLHICDIFLKQFFLKLTAENLEYFSISHKKDQKVSGKISTLKLKFILSIGS